MQRSRLFFTLLFSAACVCAANADVTRIGFGSCASQEKPQPIWDHINKLKPEVFLLIGDNIYGDSRDMSVLKAKYDKLDAMPGLKELRTKTKLLGVWDDHDYGENNAGVEYPMKRESQQLFLDFFRVPKDSPRRKQEGVYHSEIFGKEGERVQIIFLDARYFRSPVLHGPHPVTGKTVPLPNTNLTSTVLGDVQWRWLEEQLRQPAEVRLIASGIQVVPEDNNGEKWANFPHERERLFRLIRDTKANGVVFLSGDRHIAELSLAAYNVAYPLYDLTSSGLNLGRKEWRPLEVNRHRVATLDYGDNFGFIEIDWKKSVLKLEVHDGEGDVRIRQKVPLRFLSAPEKK